MDCWLKKTLECEPWAVGYCDDISQCFPNLYELTNESINEKNHFMKVFLFWFSEYFVSTCEASQSGRQKTVHIVLHPSRNSALCPIFGPALEAVVRLAGCAWVPSSGETTAQSHVALSMSWPPVDESWTEIAVFYYLKHMVPSKTVGAWTKE